MSSSRQPKERHKRRNEDGTAARTRPFTFGEIMLSRRRKPVPEDLKVGVLESEVLSRKEDVESVLKTRKVESERGSRKKRGSLLADERHVSEKGTSANAKSDREAPALVRKLKSVVSRPSDDLIDEVKGGKDEKRLHDKLEKDKRSTDYARNEAGKRDSRDLRGKESRTERSRVNSDNESKRKHRNEDGDKNKERSVLKKLDTDRHDETKTLEKDKRNESSKSRFEEPRMKKRRSKSRDRNDRHRRSISPSTRTHKRSHHNRTVEREVSPHTPKDQSQKQFPMDRNKLHSNGSGGHYRRYDEPKSGLGGYSPRKRISEDAAKTPPPLPPDQSLLEKKSAKWDILPPGTNKILSGLVLSNIHSSDRAVSTAVQELATSAKLQSLKVFASVDSVQLTQATRPMRRLYADNVPSTTTEKALVKWFNDMLLSSGVNHVPGTQPCINCIINKDKAQALVEFLTPEDASTALSYNGCSISDSVLKIRRPKDFVEVPTGDMGNSVAMGESSIAVVENSVAEVEKSVDTVDEVSDVVKDSPNKIFIGGISKTLSSKMLMEILSSFGPLKSYHFEVNGNPNEPCAFLEYVDQSVTLKACAGLNGMKLGGKVLTVVQALQSSESLGNTESSLLYEIPELAKPLLKQPTQVLKLKNVFNIEGLSEVEEVIEDIRLECVRFGNVKSVNVIKPGNRLNDDAQMSGVEQVLGCENIIVKTENSEQNMNEESNGIESEKFEIESNANERQVYKPVSETENKSPEPNNTKQGTDQDYDEPEVNHTLGDINSSDQGNGDGIDDDLRPETDAMENQSDMKRGLDLETVFETGCVFVEFGRIEAASAAAHCLHRRFFDSRIVSVDYVDLDHYKVRFPN